MIAENGSNNDNRLLYEDQYPDLPGISWTERPSSPFLPGNDGRSVFGPTVVK